MTHRHLLPALLSLLAFASCSPVSTGPQGYGGAVPQGALQTFSSPGDAVAFAKSRVAQGDSIILFRMQGPVDARGLAAALAGDSSLGSVKVKTGAGLVTVEPQYAEDVLLLRAYRDPRLEAGLSSTRKRALAKARKAVAEARCQGSDYGRALALHDYIVRNTSYKATASALKLDTCVSAVLADGVGVCEGYARAYRLLLDMAGIENRYVGGVSNGARHCWNLVRLGGQWVHVDCTYDDPRPDVPGRALHSYFGLPDSMLSASHSWSRGSVPSATSAALYHPFKNGLRFATVQECVAHFAKHPAPKSGATVYIDELKRPGANAAALWRAAAARTGGGSGRIIVSRSNPCAVGVFP